MAKSSKKVVESANVESLSPSQPTEQRSVPIFADKATQDDYFRFEPAVLRCHAKANFLSPGSLKGVALRTERSLTAPVARVFVDYDGEETLCGNCQRPMRPMRAVQVINRLVWPREGDEPWRVYNPVTVAALRSLELVGDDLTEEDQRHLEAIVGFLASYPDPTGNRSSSHPFPGVPVVNGNYIIARDTDGNQRPMPLCGSLFWAKYNPEKGCKDWRRNDEGCLAAALAGMEDKGLRGYSFARCTIAIGQKLQDLQIKRIKNDAEAEMAQTNAARKLVDFQIGNFGSSGYQSGATFDTRHQRRGQRYQQSRKPHGGRDGDRGGNN